ncbi:MAG TPA: ABC transporter ATP-binding protein [Acidimicrobiales bacterium]|nr:ABC transporter ATP-binding protein [Acidimicrobiales bacterium]
MTTAPALELRDVRAAYGRIEVLHGVSFAVPAGCVFALLGPNGAGKSTIHKVASGRLEPTSGCVHVAGIHVNGAEPEQLARAGVCTIPEGRGVFPNLTVNENLRMMTYKGGLRQRDVEERAFTRFPRLKERRKQLAGTLSGGEQQMLAMARALVTEPSLLLLDEISIGLAPIIVGQLYDLVRQIRDEGISILLVEQFAQTALAVADYAAVMAHGVVLNVGEPKDIAEEVSAAYLGGAA